MAGYTQFWSCEKCGSREETMDLPKVLLCDKCDDRTKLRCPACRGLTNVTPRDLHLQRRRLAVHARCVVVEPEPEPEPVPPPPPYDLRWDRVPS